MALELVERPAATGPERVLLLLPGYGDDAEWFTPHLDAFDPEQQWHVAVATPPGRSPDGPAWFPTGDDGPEPATVHAAARAVGEAGAALLDAHGLGPGALAVVGFSQGGAAALAALLEPSTTPPAAVAALAAFLPPPHPGWQPERSAGRPVLVAHGRDDDTVDLLLGRSAAKLLERSGARVTWAELDGAHTLSPAMAETTRRWLAELAAGPAPAGPPT
jgi:predicted esterase